MSAEQSLLQRISELPYSAPVACILMNAIRLNLFESLQNPLTAKALAAEKVWHESNTEIFLQALYALDFIEKDGDLYRNTPDATRYLIKGKPEYAGTYLLHMGHNLGGALPDNLEPLLIDRPAPTKQPGIDNLLESLAAQEDIMRQYQSGLFYKQFLDIVKSISDFATAEKILDLGSGVGQLATGIAELNQDAEIVLFDMPPMREPIARTLEVFGNKDRFTVLLGDFTRDDIGSDYDLIYASASINGAKHCLDEMLVKIYDALKPGGVFVCIADGIAADHREPWEIILSWLPYRLRSMNMEIIRDEVKNSACKAGFVPERKETRRLLSGCFDIDVLRKVKK